MERHALCAGTSEAQKLPTLHEREARPHKDRRPDPEFPRIFYPEIGGSGALSESFVPATAEDGTEIAATATVNVHFSR